MTEVHQINVSAAILGGMPLVYGGAFLIPPVPSLGRDGTQLTCSLSLKCQLKLHLLREGSSLITTLPIGLVSLQCALV